jgi:hypothetical protein
MIPIVKPKAVLPVNGMPRFVSVGKSDAAAVWFPPTPAEAVLLAIVFTTMDTAPSDIP